MNRQAALDKILEVTNLTDGLTDDDANLLIDWATKHADSLTEGATSANAAGEKVNEVMALMRQINTLAVKRKTETPEAFAGELAALTQSIRNLLGGGDASARLAVSDVAPLAARLKDAPDTEFIEAVTALADTPAPPTTVPPAQPAANPVLSSAGETNTNASEDDDNATLSG